MRLSYKAREEGKSKRVGKRSAISVQLSVGHGRRRSFMFMPRAGFILADR
jgi:hypothetical protein